MNIVQPLTLTSEEVHLHPAPSWSPPFPPSAITCVSSAHCLPSGCCPHVGCPVFSFCTKDEEEPVPSNLGTKE